MPSSYIEIGCRCGRMVRTTPEQGGTTVHCWSCGSDIRIPSQRAANKVVQSVGGAVVDTLRPQSFGALLAAAVGMTVILMIPFVGNLLAFAVLVVAFRLYQNLIRENTPPPRAGGGQNESEDDRPEWVDWALSALAATALIAPFLVRTWSPRLSIPALARPALLLVAYVGWVLVPLLLYALNARNRHGVVSRREAMASLVHLPFTAALTLLMIPLSFCVLEASSFAVSKVGDILPQLIDDYYPPPQPILVNDKLYVKFRFDDLTTTVPSGFESPVAQWVYLTGLRRGYSLIGSIPRSLSRGLEGEIGGEQHEIVDPGYMMIRMGLTFFILLGTGVALSIQARWFGLIASLGSRSTDADPRKLQSASASSPPLAMAPASPPAPALAPMPVSSPGPILSAAPAPVPGFPVGPAPAYPMAAPSGIAVARTVLIVDGDRGFAVGLGRILSDRGYVVFLASSVMEALALARGAKPDLVVLDMHLPDRSGIELCRELRNGPTRPFLIATSQTATAAEISAMAGAADDYLIKPYVFEALILRIGKHLQSRA